MTIRLTPLRVRLSLLAMLAALPLLALAPLSPQAAPQKQPERTKHAWTRAEALAQLKLYPHDPYLQYVALQLARREDRLERTITEVERVTPIAPRQQIDLFSIFTGALAVQESLQLDRMRVPSSQRRGEEPPRRKIIDIAKLSGPQIKSHPWKEMLGDKKPDISPLARMVPEDFYFVEFRSLNKMLDVLENGDLWSVHVFNQARRDARTQQIGDRLRQQLVLKTNRLLRPFYDAIVEEVALTGSDLFAAEGSDATLLFRAKKPDVLRKRMDGFLDEVLKSRRDAKRREGEYLGVPYVHVSTPERDIHVFSAHPEPGLHVRSNSKTALQRVLETIKGKALDGKPVHRLGDSTEFAYIRTLFLRGAKEEDGFVYLSDPFIRHLVGPTLKLTERRRMMCYNHLRMIGHAALLYRTEYGQAAKSLADLEAAECCPGVFNKDDLVCVDGGTYTLSADGMHGVCSHHGHADRLVPCCETPLAWVYPDEAEEYERFRNEYNNYWRSYFDPIALRIQVTPERYRLETIILPLINNSIYTGLQRTLRGKAEPLDALPVSKRTIASVAARIDKETVLKDLNVDGWLPFPLDKDLMSKGLGNQIGLHICDSAPPFDLDLMQSLTPLLSLGNANGMNLNNIDIRLGYLLASFNAPVYLSFPVQDAKIVDRALAGLEKTLTQRARQSPRGGWFALQEDFFKSELKPGVPMWSYTFRLEVVKWRLHWARIGKGLYVASKPDILKDLLEAESKGESKPEPDTTAHALVRLRARNWERVLPDYRLGWAENNRQACLRNLGPLASAGRAVKAAAENGPPREEDALNEEMQRLADQSYGVHFFCPEGGRYLLATDGRSCSCSVHGSVNEQKQPLAASDKTGPGKLLQNFGGLSASLTFLEDGLHAVVIVERQK